jgi:ribosomal protein L23
VFLVSHALRPLHAQIKLAVKKLYDIDAARINTLVRYDSGRVCAYGGMDAYK